MKFIDSGEGKVPLLSALAILAISLTVNLPGLAISPVLGRLKDVFHSTAIEAQLLNVLPNLLTIPFILGAGKICTPKNQLTVLSIGLAIFTATGIAYFFAKSMIVLIILSCILGVGIGLVIPLAASLISQNFSGKPRGMMLGVKSGLSNLSLIIATLYVGWIATRNWHWAFAAYFIPVIPLVMVPFIKSKFINQQREVPQITLSSSDVESQNFHFRGKEAKNMLWFALIIYFILSYGALVFSYYLPFTMEAYGMSTGHVGVATSMFYLAATLAGFGLSKVIKATGIWTFQLGMIVVALSLLGVGFIHSFASYIIGTFMLGLGYGVIQPILYDKTSYFAPTDAKATEYFALLLTSSYVALSCIPFIVEFFGTFIKGNTDPSFPFILNGVIMSIMAIVVVVKHKNFVVQAGVIPQGEGIVKQPSSVLTPGDRYVKSAIVGTRQDAALSNESIALESEAPVGVPMGIIPNTATPTTPSAAITSSATPSHLSPSPGTSANEEHVVSATSPEPVIETISTAPITPTSESAKIMQAAEASLADAKDSLQKMRKQQAELLKAQAQQLEDKAQELHEDALQLLDEAEALDPPSQNSSITSNNSISNNSTTNNSTTNK
ncbi:MAG: MFS transporter [Muribaculaceae bacterium]|nr:MFS transporter [Muribaculaceae bacterium]